MTNTETTTRHTITCEDCGFGPFYLIPSREATAHKCLDCGDAWMRSHGHQNDPHYSVN